MVAYPFNLPWPAIFVGVVFYAALAAYIFHLARDFVGILHWVLTLLGASFALLGFILAARRLFFPRRLEFSDEAILFPRGFPRTRITKIPYMDIIRISETRRRSQISLTICTAKGQFDISLSYLPSPAAYIAIRNFISARASIPLPREVDFTAEETFHEFPPPLLHWTEPDDWPRYRRHVVTSSPRAPRIGRALWFFLRSFAIIFLPWVLLGLLHLPTADTVTYVIASLALSTFFTILHWLNQVWPVHSTEITVRENGITQNFGKQVWDRSYEDITAWRLIERSFQNGSILILLLQDRKRVTSIAFPEHTARDRIAQILIARGIRQSDQLTVPWED